MSHPQIPDPRVYDLGESPIGQLLLIGDGESLHGHLMQQATKPHTIEPRWSHSNDAFRDTRAQLDEYFAGERRALSCR